MEIIELNIAKLAFKAIYNENWPTYLSVNIRTQSILLRRNSNGLTTDVPFANNTFEHSAGRIFNIYQKQFGKTIITIFLVKK